MFRDVPACSGMFHVPGFIDGQYLHTQYYIIFVQRSDRVTLILPHYRSTTNTYNNVLKAY